MGSEFLHLNLRLSKKTLEEGNRVLLVSPTRELADKYIAELIGRYPELIDLMDQVDSKTLEDQEGE